jgi:hypothetical protein
MGQLLKILTSSAWLLLWVVMAVQSANAQKRYPSVDDAWDGTDYRALIQRVEKDGLALPTLSDRATKPVFDRMVNLDNIPLRMGLNKELSVGIRFQKLDSALDPIEKNARYQARVDELDKMKTSARQLYSDLVQRMTETSLYSKPDILRMIGGALDELPAYQPIFTNQDRQDLTQRLTRQISTTADQELKKALTELRDAIEHSRVRT